MPEIFIIAGCNGAGKTTAAYNLLPDVFKTVDFVNADEIARGLSPFNPMGVAFQARKNNARKNRVACRRKTKFFFRNYTFRLSYLQFIKKAKAKRYGITFFFVYLNSLELAVERVAIRVSKGGHNIPEDVIRRRYLKGLNNFLKYAEEANDWYVYDNSGSEYILVAKNVSGVKKIFNFELFKIISSK